MTSSGSPYARFRRALATGNLAVVRAAAAELPAVDLADALAICLLMSVRDDERFERAAVRWLARLALERPGIGLGELVSLTLAPAELALCLFLLWTGPGMLALDRRVLVRRSGPG